MFLRLLYIDAIPLSHITHPPESEHEERRYLSRESKSFYSANILDCRGNGGAKVAAGQKSRRIDAERKGLVVAICVFEN